jgi:hypothetical protein
LTTASLHPVNFQITQKNMAQVYKGVTLPPGCTIQVPGGGGAGAIRPSNSTRDDNDKKGTVPLSCRFYGHLPDQAGLYDMAGNPRHLEGWANEKPPSFESLSKYKQVCFHPSATTVGDRGSWVGGLLLRSPGCNDCDDYCQVP